MFQQAQIINGEIELLDDTRNPQITVSLRFNFNENKIYYKASNQESWIPLYDIERIDSIKK